VANAYIKAARALRELEPGRSLRGAFKAVLIALADRANPQGQCWPGQALIASDAGCDVRTAGRVLRTLEEVRLIRRDHRANPKGGRKSDLITLLIPLEKSESQKDTLSGNPQADCASGSPPSQKDISSEPKGHGAGATSLNPQEASEDRPLTSFEARAADPAARSADVGEPVRPDRIDDEVVVGPFDPGHDDYELIGNLVRWYPRGPRGGNMAVQFARVVEFLRRPGARELIIVQAERWRPYMDELIRANGSTPNIDLADWLAMIAADADEGTDHLRDEYDWREGSLDARSNGQMPFREITR
jgi:hypothetical protein